LSGRRIDLTKIKFPVKNGVITIQGELSFVGMEKTAEETGIELKFIETSLKAINGAKEVHFELNNWVKNDAGIWESTEAKSGGTAPVATGEGIVCPDCDYVIRFCPCCGKPLAGAGKHSPSKARRTIPPVKPVARKRKPLNIPPVAPKAAPPVPTEDSKPAPAMPVATPPQAETNICVKPEPVKPETIKPAAPPELHKPEAPEVSKPAISQPEKVAIPPLTETPAVKDSTSTGSGLVEEPAQPTNLPPEVSEHPMPTQQPPLQPANLTEPLSPQAPAPSEQPVPPVTKQPTEAKDEFDLSSDQLDLGGFSPEPVSPTPSAPVPPVAPATPTAAVEPQAPMTPSATEISTQPGQPSEPSMPAAATQPVAPPVSPVAPEATEVPEAPAAPIQQPPEPAPAQPVPSEPVQSATSTGEGVPDLENLDLSDFTIPEAKPASQPEQAKDPFASLADNDFNLDLEDTPLPPMKPQPTTTEAPAAPAQPTQPDPFSNLEVEDDTPLPPLRPAEPAAESSDPFALDLDDETPLPPLKPKAPEANQSKDPFAALFSEGDASSANDSGTPGKSKDPFASLDLDLDVLEVFPSDDAQTSKPTGPTPGKAPAPKQTPADDNPFNFDNVIDLDGLVEDDKNGDKKDPFDLDDFDISKFKI
jgi:hypothetical protein